jgi:hypothetical protein
MAKNPNRKSAKKDDSMTPAMKIFLVGLVAELYLLIVRRFYVNGTIQQVVAWDEYLKVFAGVGLAVLVVGAILSILWKSSKIKRFWGLCVTGLGAFVAVVSFVVRLNMSILTLLTVVVPVAILMLLLWSLYDREGALSLTVLAVSMMILWSCREADTRNHYGMLVKVVVGVYALAVAALTVMVKTKKLPKLLPAKADPTPVYVACILSVVTVAAGLISATIAYYAIWVLAAVVFGLAVYYTVKQL